MTSARQIYLFSNYLNQYSFTTSSIEFGVEDLFPWPEIKFAFGNRDEDFRAHDLPLEMGVSIIFAGCDCVDRRWSERAEQVFPAIRRNRDATPVHRR